MRTLLNQNVLSEHAPSLILDELAAVIVPVLLNAGANDDILSSLYLFHSSSSLNSYSAFLSLILTLTI